MVAGFTVNVPEAVEVERPIGLMLILVIVFVAFQLRTDAEPEATVWGEAEKRVIEGGETY